MGEVKTGWHRHKGVWPGECWPDAGCRQDESSREPMVVLTPDEFAARVRDARVEVWDDVEALERAEARLAEVRALAEKWEQIHATIAPVLGEPPQGQVIEHARALLAVLDAVQDTDEPTEEGRADG